jgi:tripartite ATP-independent transporter DctP family solute receptor
MLTRRNLINSTAAAGTLATFGFHVGKVAAAEFTLNYANNLPADHPMNVRSREAADRIKTETGGQLKIELFPNNQLGSDADMLSQLRSGALGLLNLAGPNLSNFVMHASLSDVGFAWSGYDKVWPAMDGELGAFIRGKIRQSGLHVLDAMWDTGFRQITTADKPITSPADVARLKLRVPPSPLWTSMWKALGASPANINFSEVYPSLQTKVVDGQENPLSIIWFAKLYEVQRFCSLTNHVWTGYYTLAHRRTWEGLPAILQEIATKHLNAAARAERDDLAAINDSLQGQLAAKNLVFNSVDSAPFREALSKGGFYQEWKGKYGEEGWSILERYAGKLS